MAPGTELTPLCAQTAILLCLLDIAVGMDYLHSLGILHSDLKARCTVAVACHACGRMLAKAVTDARHSLASHAGHHAV